MKKVWMGLVGLSLCLYLGACDSSTIVTGYEPQSVSFTTANGQVTAAKVDAYTNRALRALRLPLATPYLDSLEFILPECITWFAADHAVIDYACLGEKISEVGCSTATGKLEFFGDVTSSAAGNTTLAINMQSLGIPCAGFESVNWNAQLLSSGRIMCGQFTGVLEGKFYELDGECIRRLDESESAVLPDEDGDDIVLKSFEPNEDNGCDTATATWIDKDGEKRFICQTDKHGDRCFSQVSESVELVKDCVLVTPI